MEREFRGTLRGADLFLHDLLWITVQFLGGMVYSAQLQIYVYYGFAQSCQCTPKGCLTYCVAG